MPRKVVGPKDALDRLLEEGCPRWLLEDACKQLRLASQAVSSRRKRQARRRAVRRANEPEAVKRKARAVDAAVTRTMEAVQALRNEPTAFEMLPELRSLLIAVGLWKGAMMRLKGEHEPALNHARARLIDLVRFYTGDWHDSEVSLLVGDVLDEPIDRLAQQRWRKTHADLLEWALELRRGEVLEGIDRAVAKMNRV